MAGKKRRDTLVQGPKIEKVIFWVTFGGILCLIVPLIMFPSGGAAVLGDAMNWITRTLGWIHLWFFVVVFVFLLYVALGKYGRVRFGGPDSPPEFSLFSWSAMLFCAGIGASVIYWGTIEWAYYYTAPPFDIEPRSKEAIEWAAAYGMFHWGPLAWAIYCVPVLPLGYLYWNRGRSVLRLSTACGGAIGARAADGLPGKIIDTVFILGMVGGVGTSVGLSTPLISAGIAELFGLERTFLLDAFGIVLLSALFGFSVYSGLKRGIKILSDINIWLVAALMAFVFVFGPTMFIIDSFTHSVGLIFQNVIEMSFYADAVAKAGSAIAASGVAPAESGATFSETWTIFYWAWWVAYAPFMGLFVARISRGRTVREVILGEIFAGSLGCWVVFGVLGNTSMFFDLEGSQNLTEMVGVGQAPEAIVATIAAVGGRVLPVAAPLVALFVALAFIFGATTLDSAAYVLAAVATREQGGVVEPARWHRIFWAVVLACVSLALMFAGGKESLDALKASSILVSIPLMAILVILAVSFMKWIREDAP